MSHVAYNYTREISINIQNSLFFWTISGTLSPGVFHFIAHKSRSVSGFWGLDFGRVLEQFLEPILGAKFPLENGISGGGN